MQFTECPLKGAYLIHLEKRGDERGFFARFYCKNEFLDMKLDTHIVQINTSFSKDKGTLRGIHYQLSPMAETKIVRCIRGSLHDVIVDLRPDSSTFLKWFGTELNSENRNMMYIPKGFGHAFITLKDDTEVLYLTTEFYAPEYERGIRWNDPMINIVWTIQPAVISDKDKNHPDFNPEYHLK